MNTHKSKNPGFIILKNNSDRKCSVCGAIERIMYVSEKILCKKCRSINYKRKNRLVVQRPSIVSKSLSDKKLIDLYCHQKKSLEDIAKEYNCTRQMVHLLMKRYFLRRRKRSKARVLAIKKGKFDKFKYDDINESFFSKWSPQMAWVLGLLFTDGYIMQKGKSLRVTISSIDYELLEKIRHHLNSTREIDIDVQSHDATKYIYRFDFYREKMREDLSKLGLIQRKSLNIKFPDIPEEYIRHFIRGCWDGDGSVYLTEGKINASFVSGSKLFIRRLVHELFKIGIVRVYTRFFSNDELKKFAGVKIGKYPLKIHESHRSKNISYSIKLNSRNNVEKLFHYFYNGIDESIYLTRKYKVFIKGLNTKQKLLF